MAANAFVDACGFTPVSSGTGDFVVSANIQGYQTLASAGATNAAVYSYRAESTDKSQWEEGFGAYTVAGTTLARTTVTANNLGTTAKISFTVAPNVFITALSADLQNAALLTAGTLPAARIAFAVKADQVAASSATLPVNPAVQQNHPSAAKAWVKFTGSGVNGNQTIGDSYNVTSVSRTSAGTYTITFTTPFTTANYACVGSSHAAGTTNAFANFGALATGTVTVNFINIVGPAGLDPTLGASAAFFGTQ